MSTTDDVEVSTIGFTKSSAEDFFDRLQKAGVRTVVDVRLHNTSQLAGFAKATDLAFFLKRIGGIDYVHQPLFAPTEAIMKAYKTEKGDWKTFSRDFLNLMAERQIEKQVKPEALRGACLLCAEDKPHRCHRTLVCEYLNDRWGGRLAVQHL
ncbi:DUF488 domain-containing protein [Ensifer sp.]|uniref:DUF488 domain-containing protein n=1 Tax=Ensifer sp. TaxID=1872086 RepID=UPI00289BDADD|nr:DUF488 domain-containing protein [Ensifer sp.]